MKAEGSRSTRASALCLQKRKRKDAREIAAHTQEGRAHVFDTSVQFAEAA